ncbi:hypothetical protein Achl_4247 (plasmid) [Pseudarthrobacter chlorophenolicus A6]|uniref:Uncharacterized protein n=1 Tax=Pseudarthrobacter chlorophenolicus (strain ATCC 700700 / DSM 12829 / CIP 107037 / JCM 12360 / KCTC 9906 / NCIMB 13794 / A6) TaxID=452863 RepID=B8HIF1_PSECP|nr:hypothetical protein [Pseudarthrobacter chlorophenolicus]ACL42198.1 hypothetical protein Achl_4247 [Pseudarthrobacter chlorophenolicus A6]SDQ14721.1 hypothetical protein SAMN04489738_0305 [Pseudarthrobacter chlorophenolicus]
MDNPAFFAILWRADDLDWDLTDAGLFGSLSTASDEAEKRQANSDVPDLEFAVAVVTMLDQDPVTGTPLSHINPPRATGYALASLSVTDTARRSIGHTIHEDFVTARLMAQCARSRNRASENDVVLDVVAITLVSAHSELEN